MAFQEVCIIGATGNVGGELTRQIVEKDGLGHGHPNPTRIVGMMNTKGFLLDPSGIRNPLPYTDRKKLNVESQPYERLDELLEAVRRLGLEGSVVYVDATPDRTEDMLQVHQQIVATRQRIVTANKNPLALFSTEDFHRLTSPRSLYAYNASVMAGADAVPFLQDSFDISDPVESIEGSFSGTLGFITSGLEQGRRFSEVLHDAYCRKYTETNPWDDLNGIDVARKLIILARSAGFNVSLSALHREPFIPEMYGSLPVQELLNAVEAEDEQMGTRIRCAMERGNALRYVASFQNNDGDHRLKVGLQEVAKESPLGSLKGTANLVQIVTHLRAPASCPHIIQSKGAGIEKTAAAIRADLLHFLPELKSNQY